MKAAKDAREKKLRMEKLAALNVPARLKVPEVIDIADYQMTPIQHKKTDARGERLMKADHVNHIISKGKTTSLRQEDPNTRTDSYIPPSARTLKLQHENYHQSGENTLFLEECLKKNVDIKATNHGLD